MIRAAWYALALLLAVLLGHLAWEVATFPGGWGAAWKEYLANVWGRLVLVDLYIGLTMAWVVVLLRERFRPVAFAWLPVFFVLGNIAPLGYLLWHLRHARNPSDVTRFFDRSTTPEPTP